jgi:hypothetical protein
MKSSTSIADSLEFYSVQIYYQFWPAMKGTKISKNASMIIPFLDEENVPGQWCHLLLTLSALFWGNNIYCKVGVQLHLSPCISLDRGDPGGSQLIML